MAAAVAHVPVLPGLVTLEKYLRTSYSPDCDFVDGVVEERNLGEYPHSRLQILIGGWLLAHETEWHTRTLTEQRIRVSEKQVRIADLCLLRADAPREAVTVTPPLLCIEILSPEDRIARARKVLEDYRAMGVAMCWLIDPIYRSAYLHDAEGFRVAASTERLELPGTPVFLPLDDLFARLD